MGYVLGIDLGETRTSAAVTRRTGDSWAAPEVVGLPDAADDGRAVPTALQFGTDGTVLVGRAATLRASTDPRRHTTGFVARVGDSTPVLLPEGPYPAELLAATLVGWVADEVAAIEGTSPECVALAHPPSWTSHRCAALRAALEDEGLPGVTLVPSPLAAMRAHVGNERPAVGELAMFGRLGATHLDTALLRRVSSGYELVGPGVRSPTSTAARIGDALAEHVLLRVGHDSAGAQSALTPESLAQLRAECELATERIAAAERARVPVASAGGIEHVELGTTEFDHVARPIMRAPLARLRRAASAVPTGNVALVPLAGGLAGAPLARELAGTLFGDKAAFDPDPASVVCRGASLAARPDGRAGRDGAAEAESLALPGQDAPEDVQDAPEDAGEPSGSAAEHDPPPAPPRPPVEVTTLRPPRRAGRLLRDRKPGARKGARARQDEENT